MSQREVRAMTVVAPVVQAAETDRRRFVGGSDIAAIMGVGATYADANGRRIQQTPFSVWAKKTADTLEEMDPDRKRFLDRRKRWEGPIRQMLEEEFEAKIVRFNQRYVDPTHDFFACELDYEWLDPVSGLEENGEIKTVSPFAFGERHGWGEPGTSDVPIHYAAQAMWGLGITGRRRCMVTALIGLDDLLFYPIERDEETIAGMQKAAVEFWERFVVPRVTPSPQSMEDLRVLMQRAKGRPVELTPEIHGKLLQLRKVRGELEAFGRSEEELAFTVGAFVLAGWGVSNPEDGEDATLTLGGVPVATWNKQGGSYLDQKRLKVEQPELVRKFTVQHLYRVLRFKKQS